MIIAGIYSFNRGKEIIYAQNAIEYKEVEQVIASVDSVQCKTKTSYEKTMPGRTLYSPRALNRAFKQEFESRGWNSYKVRCDYDDKHYVADYTPKTVTKGAFREIDFVKERTGVEVQFGKYVFLWSTTFAQR